MKNNSPSDDLKSTTLGWKFVAIVAVLATAFFSFLYLAMSNEPDYMPSQKQKAATQKEAPADTTQPVEKNSSE